MRKIVHPVCSQAEAGALNAPLPAVAACIAICGYAIWNARGLFSAWMHSPYDRCGGLAYLFWIGPVLFVWAGPSSDARRLNPAVFAIALACSFAGVVLDLSVLDYAALAIAIAGFVRSRPAIIPWLACSVSWMPAAGWGLSSHGALMVNLMRVAIGLASLLFIPLLICRESKR
jgi:hypothetical protein